MAAVSLIDANSVPPGTAAEVVADGKIFAVFNVEGTFHVLDGICAHAGGPLGKGSLHGNIVTCPWHGWQFKVDSGRHCLTESIRQKHYECRVEDDMVVAEVD
jgi:nitrite reductase (NADH) small subunit